MACFDLVILCLICPFRIVLKKIMVGSEGTDAAKEGRLLSAINHPNILKYKESFQENEFFCIATEYCEGGDLAGKVFVACHVVQHKRRNGNNPAAA